MKIVADTNPSPIAFFSSSQLRVAIGMVVLGVFAIIHTLTTFGIQPVLFGHNLAAVDTGNLIARITDLLSNVGLIGGAIFWMLKRIKAGADPKSDAPPIETPVATVKRLTS